MKRYNTIFLLSLLFLYVVFSSKGCEESPEEKAERERRKLQKQVETIEMGMESDILGYESIPAFEEKAKQKLIDFGEFLSLYSKKELDTELKENVAKQMTALFLNDKSRIELKLSPDKSFKKLSPDDLIRISSPEYDALLVEIDSIKKAKSLEQLDKKVYKGSLVYSQSVYGISQNDTILIHKGHMISDYYVTKIEKVFGEDAKYIWQVYLGDMKNTNK